MADLIDLPELTAAISADLTAASVPHASDRNFVRADLRSLLPANDTRHAEIEGLLGSNG